MTESELNDLEAAARAVREAVGSESSLQAETVYIKATRPRVVLELIVEIRQLNAVVQEVKRVLIGENDRSGAWTCINYIREIIDDLKFGAPELYEVSFIVEKLAALDMILWKTIELMKIPKPKNYVLREWQGDTGPYRI